MKLAFADREAYYGDPDFVDVPLEHLLSDAYNAERRQADRRAGLPRPAARHRARLRSARWRRRWRCSARISGNGRRLRADHGASDRKARRYRAYRRHRPRGQHGLGDAVRRLAAILADHSGAWLLPQFARPDVLAEARACRPRLQPGKRPAHHADAVAGAARGPARRSPSARRAATSRTSGSCRSSCAMSTTA